MTEIPSWLRELRRQRRTYNNPTVEELAHWTGLTRERVAVIFGGSLPTGAELNKLIDALVVDDDVRPMLRALVEDAEAHMVQEFMQGRQEELSHWLVLLRQIRAAAGNPTLREMAQLSGIPHTTIGNWFQGLAIPPVDRIDVLLDALAASAEDRHAIGVALGAGRSRTYRSTPSPPSVAPASADGGLADLVAAIRELTEAVRELKLK